MTTYRLTTISDDGLERDVGVLGALAVPPKSILVISIARDTLDRDLARLRMEWREMVKDYGDWKDVPTVIVRAGDIQFACLTQVEEMPN